jgi:hypothetical protein
MFSCRIAGPSLLLAVWGCAEPSAGVHVELRMTRESWDALAGPEKNRPFDRVAVMAETSGKSPVRAVACLFQDAGHVVPPSFAGEDPCGEVADDWVEPAFDRWGLQDGRTVNFVVPEDEPVTIRAEARLGAGEPVLASASSSDVKATAEFSTVGLELEAQPVESCGVRFVEEEVTKAGFVTTYDLQAICNAPCIGDVLGSAAQGSQALQCVSGSGDDHAVRIDNAGDIECQLAAYERLVWRSERFQLSNCRVRVEVSGRFSACRSGDGACPETTTCRRPETRLGVLNVADDIDIGDPDALKKLQAAVEAAAVDLSCVPRALRPVTFYADFPLTAEQGAIGYLLQDVTGDCFFELEQLKTTGIVVACP